MKIKTMRLSGLTKGMDLGRKKENQGLSPKVRGSKGRREASTFAHLITFLRNKLRKSLLCFVFQDST